MHDRGVLHGQIKTSNILLTKEGICKLSDLRIDIVEK
jgi:serine/threonine protein kinase